MGLTYQICAYLLWFPLKVLVIGAILKVGVRRYPLPFAYTVVGLLAVVAQMPAALAASRTNLRSDWFQLLHSVSQITTYILILAVVLSFLHTATSRLPARHLVRVFGI